MFNLFKKTVSNENVVAEKKVTSYPTIVDEIHNEFSIAGENLLAEAKSILEKCSKKDIEKGRRLQKLGFVKTVQAELHIKAELTQETANIVMYYQREYPNNKFITAEQVQAICAKYNLVLGDVSSYKGFVPENKISLIENFRVKNSDIHVTVFSQSTYPNKNGNMSEDNGRSAKSHPTIYKRVEIKSKFKICAPQNDMVIHSYQQVVGHEIKDIPDPIVLQPVKHGYLIVCAWGDEASDEMVVNQKMN